MNTLTSKINMINKKKQRSKKEKIIYIFNKIFSKYSKKFTTSEILEISNQIVETSSKRMSLESIYGSSRKKKDYHNDNVYLKITSDPWLIAANENCEDEKSNFEQDLITRKIKEFSY